MSKYIGNLSYGGERPSLTAQAFRNRALTPEELAATREKHVQEIARYTAEGNVRMVAHHQKCLDYWLKSNGW